MRYFIELGFSFLFSCALVFSVLKLSLRYSWFDHVNDRKIHTGEVPRLGGVGFSTAFIIVAGAVAYLDPSYGFRLRSLPLFIGMALIFLFGVKDDFKPMRPRNKFLVQSVSALLVLLGDYTFQHLNFSNLNIYIHLGWIRFPLTFLWIVGVTNALNLIDGVDGLAGGVSLLVAVFYGAIFYVIGNTEAFILCLILVGSLGGFLVFNLPFPRARIFMGDSGSQFLGFVLALLPLIDNGQGFVSIPLPYTAALLLIPIFDTFAAIWRRTRDGRRIDSPDRAHMHHKLMNLGLNALGVDLTVYALQIVIGILVFLSFIASGWTALGLLVGAYALGTLFFSALHFINRAHTGATNS
jgi:UDP-GlcNAc:undecaprenyl-phosphate GlcNAc-1-phosphate transferase